jgi:hypothetical protein
MQMFHGSGAQDNEETHPECGALIRNGFIIFALFLFILIGFEDDGIQKECEQAQHQDQFNAENSGGPATQPVPGGPATQPVPGGQTTPVQPRPALENPLGSRVNSLTGLFIKLVNIVVNISYMVVAFFLILSGFKFVVAQGKPKEIEDAKKTFWYTIVGGLIIVGAQTIARILENLVKSL